VIAVAVGTGLAVLLLLVTVIVVGVTARSGEKDSGRTSSGRSKPFAAELADAARRLASTRAVRYTGTIPATNGDFVYADLRVTGKGATHGTLTQDGLKFQVLAVGGDTYVKGGKDFWEEEGAPNLDAYAKQWVKVARDRLGVDVQALLAPATLGGALGRAATAGTFTPGGTYAIVGVPAREVTTPEWSVHVSAVAPRRIVRVERPRGGGGTPGGGTPATPVHAAVPAAGKAGKVSKASKAGTTGGHAQKHRAGSRTQQGEFKLDLAELTEAEAGELHSRLQDEVGKLKDSIDSEILFEPAGDLVLSQCSSSGCSAKVTMRNSTSSDRPVRAVITISMTLDGRPVRTCTTTKTMRPNGKTTASCRATFSIPPSPNPRTHTGRAQTHAVARAATQADVTRMLATLKQEQQGRP
jgi:hypothetical protein